MNYIDLDLNLIKTFLTVYECKSILLASKKLYVSQPAVTSSIKKLESFLGGKLFIRTPKGVIPTTEGEQFNKSSYTAIQLIENGINKFSTYTSLEEGRINIGSSSTIIRKLLLPFFEEFNKKHPKIYIDITDANSEKLQRLLKAGTIDLAIMNLPISNQSAYKIVNVTTTQDCFIAPADFPKDFLSKEELKNYPLILQKRPSNNRDYFEEICGANGINYDANIEMSSFGLITDFVSKNMGLAFTVKDFVLDDIQKGQIKILKTDLKIEPRKVGVLTLSSSVNSFVCDTFVKELVTYFNKKS